MAVGFLKKIYDVGGAEETRSLYDAWADSYDEEVGENGYVTPRRCAEALASFADDFSAPLLDFGCGTGLSGVALARAGFRTIDGVDLSADMLKGAEDKNVYRNLRVIEARENPIAKRGDYEAVAAIGVIGVGAAPIAVFDMLMKGLKRGGLMVLSFNDHTLEDPVHESRVSDWVDCAAARLLFREYGDHLPGMGLKSNVYVLERM
jgi:predicted TPR repeat methyltransferase